MTQLQTPEPSRHAAEAFVADHLGHLICDDAVGSQSFRGGQVAADSALATFDVEGYAARRNEVFPDDRRGASKLSPYIRHGLLSLRTVWDSVAGGPSRDVSKFRDELLWQEYARHWYGRLGVRTRSGVRNRLVSDANAVSWDRSMACVDATIGELEADGWLVNQTRMWLASQWTVRDQQPWRAGEDEFFRHLLDGSRAANRLGWQWTTGAGSNKPYGFSRWQVNKRAPALCKTCELRDNCPIEDWPPDRVSQPVEAPAEIRTDPNLARTTGPASVERRGDAPTHVWLTAESLGEDDPALLANPDLPVVFVFDEPLLARLQLSGKRLVFLVETLAELGSSRDLEVWLGQPEAVLSEYRLAVTHAPVPGFGLLADQLEPAEVYPWPWLATPIGGSIASFSAWRRKVDAP